MLEGKCLKCGTRRVGQALRNPRHQSCPRCGTALAITEGGYRVFKSYSPFTAEEYLINPSTNVSPSSDKEEDVVNQQEWDILEPNTLV